MAGSNPPLPANLKRRGRLVHIDWHITVEEYMELRAALLRYGGEFVGKLIADGELGSEGVESE